MPIIVDVIKQVFFAAQRLLSLSQAFAAFDVSFIVMELLDHLRHMVLTLVVYDHKLLRKRWWGFRRKRHLRLLCDCIMTDEEDKHILDE